MPAITPALVGAVEAGAAGAAVGIGASAVAAACTVGAAGASTLEPVGVTLGAPGGDAAAESKALCRRLFWCKGDGTARRSGLLPAAGLMTGLRTRLLGVSPSMCRARFFQVLSLVRADVPYLATSVEAIDSSATTMPLSSLPTRVGASALFSMLSVLVATTALSSSARVSSSCGMMMPVTELCVGCPWYLRRQLDAFAVAG